MTEEAEKWKRRFERERKARKEAESTLEKKARELFMLNEALSTMNSNLEEMVEMRTFDLEASEKRFRILVESANDIIYRVDSSGNFTYANPKALETMGYELEELKQMRFTDLVIDSRKAEVDAFYVNMLTKQIQQSYLEFPALRKDGSVVWIGQNVSIMYDDEGFPTYIGAVARNITEAKLSKSRLENLITNIQSAVLLENEKRQIVLTNQEFCTTFEIPAPPDALVGADCSESAEQSKGLFKDEQGFVDRIAALLKAKKLVKDDVLHMKNGRVLERDYIPIYIEGKYSGHMWNYRDVTERTRYLQALGESEERYRNIIANMNLGLIEVDMNDRILYVNQAFTEMCGYVSEELIGQRAASFFLDEELHPLMEDKGAQRREGISDAYELEVRHKNGEIRWWFISGGPLKDAGGSVVGSIGIHLDITERKALEDQLHEARKIAEESSKSKEQFLANMSHEIRTPMNGVVGMIREMKRTQLADQQRFYLEVMEKASDNLLVILNDILDLSKIEAGKLTLERKPFEFRSVFQQPMEVLRPKYEEKGLAMNTSVDDTIAAYFCGDEYRLNQVLMNLLGNAIKFTDKGEVTLNASLVAEEEGVQHIRIIVKDTGIGMDESFMKDLFTQFTQEDRSAQRKFGGTGLGLSISKQLVELMGGEISVESTIGKGSNFTIDLKLQVETEWEDSTSHSLSKDDFNRIARAKVLLAEDNPMNQVVLETALSHYGTALTVVSNGREAVDLLKTTAFDLVLMDVQMPVLDGISASKQIRNALGLKTPIIALTANALKSELSRYQEAGMNDHVPKPFEETELLLAMIKWLPEPEPAEVPMNAPESLAETNVSPSAEDLYSLSGLEKLSRGNQAFVDKMLGIFIEESERALLELKTAVDAGDVETFKKTSHRIKPSLGNMNIDSLYETVRRMERAERFGKEELKDLNTLSSVLKTVVDDIRAQR